MWLLGFLSGVGSTRDTTGLNPLNGMDKEGVCAWIDNYCGSHSVIFLVQAANAFVAAHPR